LSAMLFPSITDISSYVPRSKLVIVDVYPITIFMIIAT
jgi:hypothetical protein